MWKVWNHCHYTGKYRGATYFLCDLRHRNKNEIPVIFLERIELWLSFKYKVVNRRIWITVWCLGKNTEKVYNIFSTNGKRTCKW